MAGRVKAGSFAEFDLIQMGDLFPAWLSGLKHKIAFGFVRYQCVDDCFQRILGCDVRLLAVMWLCAHTGRSKKNPAGLGPG